MLLDPEDLRQFQNHSSQMAALDFMVSVASNIFIPTYDGNMARVVEGHRRYEDELSKWWMLYLKSSRTKSEDSCESLQVPWVQEDIPTGS